MGFVCLVLLFLEDVRYQDEFLRLSTRSNNNIFVIINNEVMEVVCLMFLLECSSLFKGNFLKANMHSFRNGVSKAVILHNRHNVEFSFKTRMCVT